MTSLLVQPVGTIIAAINRIKIRFRFTNVVSMWFKLISDCRSDAGLIKNAESVFNLIQSNTEMNFISQNSTATKQLSFR